MSHQRKASALSFLGGALCGLGWLMFVDALCVGGFLTSGDDLYTCTMTATPVCLATLFILTLNITSVDDMRESYFSYGLYALSWGPSSILYMAAGQDELHGSHGSTAL
ncbi:hypothetical protein GUITHDRAFT_99734 [Guillardia theta CCMP2712]|uniref:Uncharacterized protein n=1 Tax=Guillardia theta (strain CCMP2712) TaxID=905079 RepID=L1K3R1_GUITC|nr:hypothetical protein GUITHDRAFT_99734 [Guillardia theta CCMP2712]EKX55105.1 hypothetical protein GUITHDRAFT_99734 [Guillardia theta CCMP2712]|eukprot:XP_005842085.1 hypothetical protein GUITHDRAFT_99734 [Guillardia theta CCMP2712]